MPEGGCRGIFLVTEHVKQATEGSELAPNKLAMTSDSEGDTDEETTVQPQQNRATYLTKTGSTKKHPTNRVFPIQINGEQVQTFALWHRRLAHASPLVVRKFLQTYYPISLPQVHEFPFCDVCTQTKMTKKAFDKVRTLPTRPGEVISADVIGPISPVTSPNGYRFVLTVIDGFTKFERVFLMKRKTESVNYLRMFFTQTRAQHMTKAHFKTFRSDNGKEFVNKGVQALLLEYGMEHQITEPYTSPHNTSVERLNRTIEQKTRSLLADSGFPTSFWGLAIGAAEYIYNRTHHSAINYELPIVKWETTATQTHTLALFGAVAYQLTPNKSPGKKFDEVSQLRFIAGYSSTGYLLFDPQTRKTIESCNVKIDETRVYKDFYKGVSTPLTWTQTPDISPTPTQGTEESQNVGKSHEREVEIQIHTSPTQTSIQSSDVISYQSIDLSDCSLPQLEPDNDLDQGLTSNTQQGLREGTASMEERTYVLYGDQVTYTDTYQPVTVEDAPEDGVDWDIKAQQKRRQIWENREMTYCLETIPQQLGIHTSPTYLFPIRIPDKINKQDLFQNPHPKAPKTYTEAVRWEDSSVWREVMQIEVRAMQELDVWEESRDRRRCGR